MFKRLIASAVLAVLMASPALAVPATNSKLKNNLQVTGTLNVAGAATFSTPLTLAAVNNAVESKMLNVPIGPGTALADSTTYVATIAPGRAGVITRITVGCGTKPVGGTNTVTIQKNGATNVLSASNFDPTTLSADNVATQLSLTATSANLVLAATDIVKITWATGVQTTDAIAPTVTLEFNNNADY